MLLQFLTSSTPRPPPRRLLLQARLWRLVLLQNHDGSFEPTDSLAFSLQALKPESIPPKKVFTGAMRYIQKFQRADDADVPDDVGGADEQQGSSGGGDRKIPLAQQGSRQARAGGRPGTGAASAASVGGGGSPATAAAASRLKGAKLRPPQQLPAASSASGASPVALRRGKTLVLMHAKGGGDADDGFDPSSLEDCPLSYSADAILRTIPRVLLRAYDAPRPPRRPRRLVPPPPPPPRPAPAARQPPPPSAAAGGGAGRGAAAPPRAVVVGGGQQPLVNGQDSARGFDSRRQQEQQHATKKAAEYWQQGYYWKASPSGVGWSGGAQPYLSPPRPVPATLPNVAFADDPPPRSTRRGGARLNYSVAQERGGYADDDGWGSPPPASQVQPYYGGYPDYNSRRLPPAGSYAPRPPAALPPPRPPPEAITRWDQRQQQLQQQRGGTVMQQVAQVAQPRPPQRRKSGLVALHAANNAPATPPPAAVAASLGSAEDYRDDGYFEDNAPVGADEDDDAAEPPVERVWATCLAMACCEGFDVTWLVDPDRDLTIVDQSRMWLDRLAADDPRLRAALPAAVDLARVYVKRWSVAFLDRVNDLRNKENEVNRFGLNTQQALEATGTVVKSLLNDHDTFAVFTSDCMTGLERYQRWMVLLTLVLGGLLITIWFYSSRAQNCCLEVRAAEARSLAELASAAHHRRAIVATEATAGKIGCFKSCLRS